MAKPDGRVEAGQSLKRAISAQRWNDLCDAADIVHGRRGGVTQADIRGPSLSYVPVLVRNGSTGTIEKGETLAVTGLVIAPTGSVGGSNFVAVGELPQDDEFLRQPFVVAVTPIAAGAIGRAAIDGVVIAKLNITSDDHASAIPTNNSPFLKSAKTGPATILWKPSVTGASEWSLVQLNKPSGDRVIRGTFAGAWDKSSIETVSYTDAAGNSQTQDAKNYFADVGESGVTSSCCIIRTQDEWILIAAECG